MKMYVALRVSSASLVSTLRISVHRSDMIHCSGRDPVELLVGDIGVFMVGFTVCAYGAFHHIHDLVVVCFSLGEGHVFKYVC